MTRRTPSWWWLALLVAGVGLLVYPSVLGVVLVLVVGVATVVWRCSPRRPRRPPVPALHPLSADKVTRARATIQRLRLLLQPHFPGIATIPIELSTTTSYTVNKERVFLCLFDEHGRLYDTPMLVYVLLHEYAHVINSDVGHTTSFFQTFATVLQTAREAGLYDPALPLASNYCHYAETT